jgi:hypothetical protein
MLYAITYSILNSPNPLPLPLPLHPFLKRLISTRQPFSSISTVGQEVPHSIHGFIPQEATRMPFRRIRVTESEDTMYNVHVRSAGRLCLQGDTHTHTVSAVQFNSRMCVSCHNNAVNNTNAFFSFFFSTVR